MDLARSPPRGRALGRRRAATPPRDEALGHPGLKSGAAQSKRWISLEARHEGGLSVDAVLPSLRGTRHSGTPDFSPGCPSFATAASPPAADSPDASYLCDLKAGARPCGGLLMGPTSWI